MKTNTFVTSRQIIATGTLGVMALGGTAMLAQPAHAGSDTWKKVAIGAAAVTGYGLLKGKGKVATIGALATAGSYYMYKKNKKKDDKSEARRQAWYQQRYGRNWRSHYSSNG